MASKKKAAKVVAPEKVVKKSALKANAATPKAKPAVVKKAKPASRKTKPAKVAKPKAKKLSKATKPAVEETAQLLSSETVYQGPLFRVQHDKLIEPGGKPSERDVIRHNGSVVILAVARSKRATSSSR